MHKARGGKAPGVNLGIGWKMSELLHIPAALAPGRGSWVGPRVAFDMA